MEDQITNLIKKYEKLIQHLKTCGRNELEHFNNNISVKVYNRVINDLRAISEKIKDESKL